VVAGLLLGVVESGTIFYLSHNAFPRSYGPLSVPFSLLFWIISLLIVGALAGKHTGKIVTGTLSGLWAGMVGSVITTVTFFTLLMPSYYGYSNSMSMMAANLTYMIFLVLAALGIGTGLGALGGLIGQSFSTSAQATLQPRVQGEPQQGFQPASGRRGDPPQQERELLQYQENSIPSQAHLD
jgi:uncharacterized membrane protein YeaQ/YmgE (transglycosylase-associated protein family)